MIVKGGTVQVKYSHKLIAGLILAGAIGIFSTAVAWAAIPDGNSTIHVCYRTGLLGTGQVRVIDTASQNCNSNETALSWNAAAPGDFVINLAGADFISADLRYRNFAAVNFAGANFTQANLTGADLHGANLANTMFNGTVRLFANTNFTNVHFAGVALQSTNLSSAVLAGATWSNTVCPDSTNSDNNGNTCIGHLVP